jgi:SAM-dependent methyltransferase
MFWRRLVSRLRYRLRLLGGARFRSAAYWQERYRSGGTSGAGSYGRLAQWKAEFLNRFAAEQQIRSVVEFGCGDGNQLALFDFEHYVGFDVSPQALELCRARVADRPADRYEFLPMSATHPLEGRFDLALSLDVIYHLVEDEVFAAYLQRLFSAAARFVVIYSSDVDHDGASHVRHRNFSRWVAAHAPDWRLLQRTANPYPFRSAADDPQQTSVSDFFCYVRLPG